MASQDLHDITKTTPAIPPALYTGNALTLGAIIDTNGFESIQFVAVAGDIVDGEFGFGLIEGDLPDLSDGVVVVDPTTTRGPNPFHAGDVDSNTTQHVGYMGNKRYVQLTMQQTGATTGGVIGALAVQGHPRIAPVPEQ